MVSSPPQGPGTNGGAVVPLSLIVAGPHRAFKASTEEPREMRALGIATVFSVPKNLRTRRRRLHPARTYRTRAGRYPVPRGIHAARPSTALCMTSKWWQMRRRNFLSHHTRQSSSHPPSRLLLDYLDHYHVFCRLNCHHDPYELPRLVLYCIHMYPTRLLRRVTRIRPAVAEFWVPVSWD